MAKKNFPNTATDNELVALQVVTRTIGGLEPASQIRVLRYLCARFLPKSSPLQEPNDER